MLHSIAEAQSHGYPIKRCPAVVIGGNSTLKRVAALTEPEQRDYLARIAGALRAATAIAKQYAPGTFHVADNGGREATPNDDVIR